MEKLLSKDFTWQMEKRKQEQIKVSQFFCYFQLTGVSIVSFFFLLFKKIMSVVSTFLSAWYKGGLIL